VGNEEIHEVPYNLQAAERSLTYVPIFRKPVIVFIAIQNLPLMKTISGFRDFDLGLVVHLKNEPIRCNTFRSAFRRLIGELYAEKETTTGNAWEKDLGSD
jgi:hypothetical protein